MTTLGKLKRLLLIQGHFYLSVIFDFSATGDPDTPISEGEDDLGNTQGGNG